MNAMGLRPYQREAIDTTLRFLESSKGSPIISVATGGGKSIIQAELVRECATRWPTTRYLLLAHVKELLQQNASKLLGLDYGIYSSGLNKRELGHQITVAGIQSVHRIALKLGDINLAIVDECHLISRNKDTMYRKFFDTLLTICPRMRIIGMSATPYRLDSGGLISGENALFTDIAYNISIAELINQGYLSPLVTAKTVKRVNTSGVKKSGGEYVNRELATAADAITEAAVTEAETLCADRKSWLVFCVSRDHAEHVATVLRERGHSVGVVLGSTPAAERARILDDFRAQKLRAVVSVSVITTGFDAPCADALICLRPTMSAGLWVQMVGRISRLYPEKENGLVCDFTDNTFRHGPIDLIECTASGDAKPAPYRVCSGCGALMEPRAQKCTECGAGLVKECKKCRSLIAIGSKTCPECSADCVRKRSVNHKTEASGGEILSKPNIIEVTDHECQVWSKPGKPPSMRVTYWCGLGQSFSEWICFEHGGFAASKAKKWWIDAGGKPPFPEKTKDAINRFDEINKPDRISVVRDGKYWRVSRIHDRY